MLKYDLYSKLKWQIQHQFQGDRVSIKIFFVVVPLQSNCYPELSSKIALLYEFIILKRCLY